MHSKPRIQNEFRDSNAFETRMHFDFGLCRPPSSKITNEFMNSNAFEAMNPKWIYGFECIRIHEFICEAGGWPTETEARMHSGFEGIQILEFILDSWLRMHSNPWIHLGFMASNAFEARMHSNPWIHFGFLALNAFKSMNSFRILGFECIRIHEFILDSWLRMHSNPWIHFGFLAANAFESMNSFEFIRIHEFICILASANSHAI